MIKFILSILAISLFCCQPIQSPKYIGSTSVAFVRNSPFGDGVVPFCSGNFISKDKILTASHCVSHWEEDQGRTDEDAVLTFVIQDDQPDDLSGNPKGTHLAKLFRIDRERDLALLNVIQPETFPHSFADVATKRPKAGTPVVAISSPRGQWFSYQQGFVSSFRKSVSDSDFTGSFLGITLTGAYYGSSGGAIIADGKIVSVVSMTAGIPSVLLGVDTLEINHFIEEGK